MATVASTNIAIGADISGYRSATEEVKRRNKELRRSFAEAGQGAKTIQRFGAPALSALSAGFSAASSAADGFNTSMAAVATSMLSAFAAGGPTGLAIAAMGTTIGLIVASLNKATREAKAFSDEIVKTQESLDKTAQAMEGRVLKAQAALIEAQTMGRLKAADIVAGGMFGAEKAARERELAAAQKVFAAARTRRDAAFGEVVALREGFSTSAAMEGSRQRADAANQNFIDAARALGTAASNLENLLAENAALAAATATRAILEGDWRAPGPVANAAGFMSRGAGGGRIHEFVGVPGGDLPITEDQGDEMIQILDGIKRNTANPPPARAR